MARTKREKRDVVWAKMPTVNDLREIPRAMLESIDPYTDWAKVEQMPKPTGEFDRARDGYAIVYEGKPGQVFLFSQGWTTNV